MPFYFSSVLGSFRTNLGCRIDLVSWETIKGIKLELNLKEVILIYLRMANSEFWLCSLSPPTPPASNPSFHPPNFIPSFFKKPIKSNLCCPYILGFVLSLCYSIRYEDVKTQPPHHDTPCAWAPIVPSRQNPLDPTAIIPPRGLLDPVRLPVKWADASWVNTLALHKMRSPERKINRKTWFLWSYQFKIQNTNHGSEHNSTGNTLGVL